MNINTHSRSVARLMHAHRRPLRLLPNSVRALTHPIWKIIVFRAYPAGKVFYIRFVLLPTPVGLPRCVASWL